MSVTFFHNPKCSTSRNALALVRERFGVRLGMADFYRQPTLAGLARHLEGADAGVTKSQLEEGVL